MAAWTPAHLEAAGRPVMQIRAVEKTMKMVMVHLLK
jgi:symplekin